MAKFHKNILFKNFEILRHDLKLFPRKYIAPSPKYNNGRIVMNTRVDPRFPIK